MESDENLAERIYLAPSSWSTAGPDDAYRYWVRAFNPAVEDVEVYSDVPGEVDIYFTLQDGTFPEDSMLEEMSRYLHDESIRPLTDYVVIRAPAMEEYEIHFTYYINRSDRMQALQIQEQVQRAVNEYVVWQKKKIGRDINPDKLREGIVAAGAKRVEIDEPVFRTVSKESIAVIAKEPVVLYGGVEDD